MGSPFANIKKWCRPCFAMCNPHIDSKIVGTQREHVIKILWNCHSMKFRGVAGVTDKYWFRLCKGMTDRHAQLCKWGYNEVT